MILPLEATGRAMEQAFPVSEPLHVIEAAGHFLPEDQGKIIGETIADWLSRVS